MFFFYLLSCFVEVSELNVNIVDPDQTPRSAASDLGLHCLAVSLLWDARLNWVKIINDDIFKDNRYFYTESNSAKIGF